MSSRAKPRDLQSSQTSTQHRRQRHSPFCHPERSRGICSPLNQQSNLNDSATLPFVIPSEAEGSAVLSTSTQHRRQRHSPLCHPERSRGICSPLKPAPNIDDSATLPFVIPSEAEGSAVLSTSTQHRRERHSPLCHPERSRPVPACRGGICGSLNQHPTSTTAPLSPLSSRAKPTCPGLPWRDLQSSQPAPNIDDSATLPFVIPSEAEGSAVLSTSTQHRRQRHSPLCHPERSRGICSPLNQQSNLNGSATLPFVIPSEAEGSAVLSTSTQHRRQRGSPLCHPERSRGICSPLNQHPTSTTAPLSPLSSRAKPRDLQSSQPAPNIDDSATLPFVIPSEAEGSAVLSTSTQHRRQRGSPLCHPERSREICSPLNQHPTSTTAPLSPLSSRAKPRDLQSSQPAPNIDDSATLPFVIPSEAEGSAVLSTSTQHRRQRHSPLCHPE